MKKLEHYFVAGLVAFLPLALTVKLLILTFNFADNFLGKYIAPYFAREFGFYFRGLSLLICLILIVLIGFLVSNFLGRKAYPFLENLLLKLPFFKQVYPPFKEVAQFLFSKEKLNFSQVVLVEYPSREIYSMGFLTNEVPEKIAGDSSRKLYYVFVPHTPSPLTGFLTLVPRDRLRFMDISVEEAIKIIVSGGVVNTKEGAIQVNNDKVL